MSSPDVAIWYQQDGYRTDSYHIVGRIAAGEAFLKAHVTDPAVSRLYCVAPSREECDRFAEHVRELGGKDKACHWIEPGDADELGAIGTIFYPSPDVHRLAWVRRRAVQRAYSICGQFHTTATHGVMDIISQLPTAPVQPWDAIVCSSRAMKAMVERELELWCDYLEARIGARPELGLKLPVIPLGVDCDTFVPSKASAAARKQWRQRFQIADDQICVLYFGRLSYRQKANPYPMYVGLERAAQASGRKLHLVQAGWFANERVEQQFVEAARSLCPSVSCSLVDGEDPEVRRALWHAADIFTSLSDNIQETFGLVPIEAMAAGLPVVVTDWDGYRETVRDGVDGFRIPTWQPGPGSGRPLARLYETGEIPFENYVGEASQSTAVDLEFCAQAFERLIVDADLRQRMGQSGRDRARKDFDWPQILSRYRDLWAELAELRCSAPETAPRPVDGPSDPRRDDPFSLFAGYPSEPLTFDTQARRAAGASEAALEQCLELDLLRILRPRGADPDMRRLFAKLNRSPQSVRDLAKECDNPLAELRAIGWLAKCGLVTLSNPPPERKPQEPRSKH